MTPASEVQRALPADVDPDGAADVIPEWENLREIRMVRPGRKILPG